MADAASQINTGTSLDSVVGSLNGKPMDTSTYQKGETALIKENEKVRKEEKDMPLATPPKLTPAPDTKDYATNPMQTFGSFGMVLATLGSALTKHPMTSALNAGAEVFKAKNAGDADAYKNAMDKWKVDSENAWKQADWEQKNFENMRSKYKDDLDGLNREAELWAAATKNPSLDAAVKAGQVREYMDSHAKAVEQMKDARENKEKKNDVYQGKLDEWLEKNKNPDGSTKDIKQIPKSVSAKIFEATENEWKQAKEGKLSAGDRVNFDFAGLKPGDIVPGLGLPLAAVDQKVQGLHDGLSYANVGVPMRTTKNPLKDAVDARLSELHPNFNYKEAQLDKAEQTRELASNAARTASAKAAVNEMDTLGTPMINAMKKLDPGTYPDWNSVKNAYDKKTGGADVVKAFQAVQDFKTAFVSLMVKNGVPTDSARATSDDIASINFSLDQIEGVRDQAKITGAAVLDALDTTKKQIIGGKSKNSGSKLETYSSADYKKAIADKILQKGDRFLDNKGVEHEVQ